MNVAIKWVLGSGLAVVGTMAVWDAWVSLRHRKDLYNDINAVPHHRYALVLGTSPTLDGGGVNRYYQHRIEAAAALYHAGKVDLLVVSGSEHGTDYSEPKAMREDLMAMGVPETCIFMDQGGDRTLDSVLYAKSRGLMDNWLVVSQAFHNQRSLMIAKHLKVSAKAYNADAVNGAWRVVARERFARVRLAWDLLAGRVKPYQSPELVRSKTEV